jgi:hypothetical protein
MVIFHGYVSLPEGRGYYGLLAFINHLLLGFVNPLLGQVIEGYHPQVSSNMPCYPCWEIPEQIAANRVLMGKVIEKNKLLMFDLS